MKIGMTFKTPDVVDDELSNIKDENIKKEMKNLIYKFVKWGEYVTIEFDSDTGEAKVLPA